MENSKPVLLIVDDDSIYADTLAYVLKREFTVHVAGSRPQAKQLLRELDSPPQLAMVDLGLPPLPDRPDEGFQLIADLIAYVPDIKIVVLSGQSDEANAKHARTIGAIEFIAKPCEPARALTVLRALVAAQNVERDAAKQGVSIVGDSLSMQKLRSQIEQYADAPFPVLIEGESGSGKELVALALHRLRGGVQMPYFALNCAAISPTLVEPTLFGYAKGAFTGANAARAGYFEDAANGTLFLDEIGELPLDMQAKLLRVLENGEFQRVGETLGRRSNARVIAATNRDLRQEIKAGRFRPDLYHRLSVFTIDVPPLRELGDDKQVLLDYFRYFYAQRSKSQPFALDAAALQQWMRYGFPGNVRELRNVVIRLHTKYAGQLITSEALESELDMDEVESGGTALPPTEFNAIVESAKAHLQSQRHFNLDVMLHQWERGYVEAALALTMGNLSQAAKLLGIQRTTLYSRMQHYGKEDSKVS